MAWVDVVPTPGLAPVLLETENGLFLTTEAGDLISTGADGVLWDDVAVTPEVWTQVSP